MSNISYMNRAYKTNMTDILDLPVLLKKNATAKYFRELENRANALGLLHGKGGCDPDNGIYFEITVNGKVYRFTFCFQFSTHSLDGLVVE